MENNKRVYIILLSIIVVLAIAWGVLTIVQNNKDLVANEALTEQEQENEQGDVIVEPISIEAPKVELKFSVEHIDIAADDAGMTVYLTAENTDIGNVFINEGYANGHLDFENNVAALGIINESNQIRLDVYGCNPGTQTVTATCGEAVATLTIVVNEPEGGQQATQGVTSGGEQTYDYTQDPTLPPVTGSITYINEGGTGPTNPGASFG